MLTPPQDIYDPCECRTMVGIYDPTPLLGQAISPLISGVHLCHQCRIPLPCHLTQTVNSRTALLRTELTGAVWASRQYNLFAVWVTVVFCEGV